MIVCICNVLSDIQIEFVIASASRRLGMSGIYAAFGCRAKCGRCTSTIKKICDDAHICGADIIPSAGATAH